MVEWEGRTAVSGLVTRLFTSLFTAFFTLLFTVENVKNDVKYVVKKGVKNDVMMREIDERTFRTVAFFLRSSGEFITALLWS